MKKIMLAVAILMATTTVTTAQAGTLTNNIGSCGIGTMLFADVAGMPNGGWLIQALAGYTNLIFTNQLISATFGIMGCSGAINKVVDADVELFVTANIDSLAKDIAQGSGETLNTLASMLEVADVDAFSTKLQANFAYIFPTADVQSSEVASKVVELL